MIKICSDCDYEEDIIEGVNPVGFPVAYKNGRKSVLKRCRPCNAARKAKYKKGAEFYDQEDKAYRLAAFINQFFKQWSKV